MSVEWTHFGIEHDDYGRPHVASLHIEGRPSATDLRSLSIAEVERFVTRLERLLNGD